MAFPALAALFPFLPAALKGAQALGDHPGMQDVGGGQPAGGFLSQIGGMGGGMGQQPPPQQPQFAPVGPHQTPPGGQQQANAIPALMQTFAQPQRQPNLMAMLMGRR